MKRLALILTLLMTLPMSVLAVQPDEVLSDPGLEARARQISQKLRCPVCQGENIDESNAAISPSPLNRLRNSAGSTDPSSRSDDFAQLSEYSAK